MGKWSIRARLTLFCTMIVGIIALAVMVFVLLTTDFQMVSVSRSHLERTVREAFDDITYETDRLEIESSLDLYQDGISLILYGPEGTLMLGSVPASFPASTPLTADTFQTVGTGEDKWQVYDVFMSYPGQEGVWIRGIYPLRSSQAAIRSVMLVTVIAFPLMILIASFGGAIITRRALAPIQKINQAVDSIRGGNDLTRRIETGNGRDEISVLSQNFNLMFDRLEQSFESEKRFSSDVSHELRTPISVILSQCEYLLDRQPSEGERTGAVLAVQRQARKMKSIISQMLEYSRAINKETVLYTEPVNLGELCVSVAEEMEVAAKKKGISLRCETEKSVWVVADQTMLMRMLVNLISNAIQYGKKGGNVAVRVKRDEKAGDAILEVEDDGQGMVPEQRERIFERLYRGDGARASEDGHHLGLGLPMVKWIVEAHGGQILVSSEIEKGSTFTVLLPIASTNE